MILSKFTDPLFLSRGVWNSGWMGWLVLAIQLLVVGQILRAWVGPTILRVISKRVQVRRVSLRSIRGVYVRLPTMTIRVDRVGISYHRSAETAHRFSLKVEGLWVELHEVKLPARPARPVSARLSRLPRLTNFSPSPIARWIWSLYSAVYACLEPHLRPLVRTVFVTFTRIVIRCLPLLTQVIDFELERAMVTFTTMPEAHLTIRCIILSAAVEFSDLENVVDTPSNYPTVLRHPRFSSMAHLRTRFTKSVKRAWGRAWGRTRGSASFHLKIQNVIGFASTAKWQQANPGVSSSAKHVCASRFAFVTHSSHLDDVCFELLNPIEIAISFQVGKTQRIIKEHSVYCSLKVPSAEFSAEPCSTFLDAIRNSRKKADSPPMPLTTGNKISTLSGEKKRRHSQSSKASLFRRIEAIIENLSVRHVIWSKDGLSPRYFIAGIRRFSSSIEFGEPKGNVLHRDFLGCWPEEAPRFDTELISHEVVANEITVQRYSTGENTSSTLRVVSIESVRLQSFATQWELLGMPSGNIFPGDPNAALLVVKLNVLAPQFSERVDVVTDILDYIKKQRQDASTPHKEPRHVIRCVPRMKLDLVVDDIAACLSPPESDQNSASPLILSSTHCVLSLSSCFRFFPLGRSTLPEIRGADFLPLEAQFTVHALLGPVFVMTFPKPSDLDEVKSLRRHPGATEDPLFSLGILECTASGEILGALQDSTDEVILDVDSTITDVKCVTDAISVELWQPSAILSLKSLLHNGRDLSNPHVEHESALLKSLPARVTAHFTIEQLVVITTGKDIDPNNDADLSRGLTIRSGFSLQYCSMHDRRLLVRFPKLFAHAHDRQRLYLSEDLLYDVISMNGASVNNPTKFALIRCVAWGIALRTCVATKYAADQVYELDEEIDELKSTEFLWIRRLEVNALSRYLSEGRDLTEEQLQLTVRVPCVQARIELAIIYSVLLALRKLGSFGKRRESSASKQSLRVTIKATVTTVQAMLKLPLQGQGCLRTNGLILRSSGESGLTVEWGSLFAWVPSSKLEGKWEEILRLRSWKMDCTFSQRDHASFAVIGEGARLRIPHRYIIADLILDINLFVKCVKHLLCTTSSGVFEPLPSPAPEEAKVVPVIGVQVECLCLEASDDPFESGLGLAWRAGFEAARSRLDREEAFQEKVAAIKSAEDDQVNSPLPERRFGPAHTVSIEEARERLLLVHSLSWITLHREYRDKQRRSEIIVRKEVRGEHFHLSGVDIDPLVPVVQSTKAPPLVRFMTTHVKLNISAPKFPKGDLPEFLHDLGKGLPHETRFTLLIPMHLRISLGSTCVTLRDYPLPLLNIVQDSPTRAEAWVVDTNFVIAEELGPESSVVWRECPVVHADARSPDTESMFLPVPKTTMPVKTYANPTVHVLTSQLTEFCWCNSYQPALQDVMRIFDTLTTPPPDPSPLVGFWDKIRLVLHWRAEFNFASDVHLNLKGSRDPFATDGDGAGFSFCWHGHTKMMVGQANPDNELLQVCSDTMLVVVPEYYKRPSDEVIGGGVSSRFARGPISLNQGLEGRRDSFEKICAKFSSGIKWGIGIVLERTCEQSCPRCGGKLSCREFDFLPHYEVRLRPKQNIPAEHTPEDSYNGFRSDFIHLSTSLASSVDHKVLPARLGSSNFHLTPKTFAHFWSWWGLFDRYLSLPVRQGRLFPNARPPSKKFGRHLATIKYRIDVQRLFISHMYLDDGRESWSEGVTHCVGVKGLVHSFEADLHQREQEAIVPGVVPNTLKKIRHKPFYAAEVKLTDLQLNAFLATFSDPTKGLFDLQDGQREGKYKDVRTDEVSNTLRESWYDMDDFVELGWEPPQNASCFCIFPVTSCPRFTYLRRSGNQPHHRSSIESSRFGNEDSHVCLMGKEKSVRSLQVDIIGKRILELREHIASLEQRSAADRMQHASDGSEADMQRIRKSIRQLEGHAEQLQDSYSDEAPSAFHQSGEYAKYLMPSEISFPVDWTEFDNVYQAHCPKFRLENSTREILTQYYYCSRARRGLEYHMATRAVKYIRDQLKAHSRVSTDTDTLKKIKNPTSLAAQVAAQALRKILTGSDDESSANNISEASGNEEFDPMAGWSDEVVSQNKSHFCLLLKPQIILRTEGETDSVLVLAALQAMLQSHTILDTANVDDPISGRVMTRTHAVLSELQAFSPTATCTHRHDGVPLEVLLDLRAESVDFDRLVPQTNATLRHDKFNRLRLRNDVTSAIPDSTDQLNSHLQHQTDLIHIRVPRFTVLASSKNFGDITNIITTLLLRSDNAHKMHLSKVETLLFSYDFTDLSAAAEVVEGLQSRLRRTLEHERDVESLINDNDGQGYSELMRMKAHIFLLSEELNLIFDAINLAQQKVHDKNDDMKMALKVHASAREISWGMMNGVGGMIAKLAIRDIEHNWLNRQDGSTVNSLVMMDLQAFDGSQDAEWPEILSKYREPSSHPLVKRGIFLQADWAVLAPVGGITILERFILELHPIRLQLEARVGKNIMEYIWPARRERKRLRHRRQSSEEYDSGGDALLDDDIERHSRPSVMSRLSLDVSSTLHARKRHSTDETLPAFGLPSSRLTSSRSFTDLKAMSRQSSMNSGIPDSRGYSLMNKSRSDLTNVHTDKKRDASTTLDTPPSDRLADDAAEMKTRSSQKTFVLVRISSMHILLSFHKDGAFFCRDARIHTRELQYHNQTWSFEELAEQFIPSDTSWRGWMRVALHQPLVPVLPVARELITKTKWGAKKDKDERRTRKIVKPKPRKNDEIPDIPGSLAQSEGRRG